MKTNTSEEIRKFIEEKDQVSAKEIVSFFEISKQAVFKHLKNLLQEGKIKKIGSPPRVFYSAADRKHKEIKYLPPKKIEDFIEKRFFDITLGGEIETGWQGFAEWCLKRNWDLKKSAEDYFKILSKYDKIRKDGLIDGTKKMRSSFPQVCLDNIFYIDLYDVEKFGKTRLGKALLYAKQGQDRKAMKEIFLEAGPYIQKLVKKHRIDAVAFIPPAVKRERQFMKELENSLNIDIPKISVDKVKTRIVVPQKTLSRLGERVENAKTTFFIREGKKYKNILLIDDAVGSGATFNEIAFKLRKKGIAKGKIIGLAIVGTLKGFDVISEV